jgi:hypothetical protein
MSDAQPTEKGESMASKTQKRLDVLNQKQAKLRQQIAGEVKQNDDPALLAKMRDELKAVEAEIQELKGK